MLIEEVQSRNRKDINQEAIQPGGKIAAIAISLFVHLLPSLSCARGRIMS